MSPLAVAASLALALVAGRASAAKPRALTALDDARGCAVLASGGHAVATGGGLVIVRKDGTAFTLTSLDGLPDTRVHAVVESGDGLWVGTEGGAALVTLPGAPAVARTLGSAPVHAILPASSGIYLGTWGGGVLRLADKTSMPSLLATSGTGQHVSALAEHGGVVHVAYSDGPVTRIESGALRTVPGTPTHGQALASTGARLVLGDLEGLYRVEGTVSSFASVDARGLAASGDKLLVATYGTGLLTSSGTSGATIRAEAGVPRWVRGVAVRGASRCAATTEGLFVDEGAGWSKVGLGGPPSNDVTTLAANGARVLVGTFDHGAALYDGRAFKRVAGLEPNETVNASAWQGEGSSARLWLGTAHGLVRVDAEGAVTRRLRAADGLPSSIVRAVLVLSPERLLIGTEEGAAFVDVEGDRITPLVPPKTNKKGADKTSLGSPNHATWALASSADGTLFIGTATGLYYGKNGRFARASVSGGELKDDWVTALAVRGSDVYVGTYAAGVTRLTFDPSMKEPHPTHLGGGYVNPDGLVFRGDELVASTMDGLLVRPIHDDAASWKTRLDLSSGRDVTAARVVGATLWVASRRGIAVSAL